MDDVERGYEITIFIPDKAPAEVIDTVMDAVCDLVYNLESPDRAGWDFSVSGRSVK